MAVVLMVSAEFTGIPVVLPIGPSLIRLGYFFLFVHQDGLAGSIQQGEDLIAMIPIRQGGSVVVATVPPFFFLSVLPSICTIILPLMTCRVGVDSLIRRCPCRIGTWFRISLRCRNRGFRVEVFGLGVDCCLLHQFIVRAPVATVHQVSEMRGPKATLEGAVGCPIICFRTP